MKSKLLLCLLMITNLSFGQKDSTNVDSFQETDKVLSEVVKKALIVAEKTGEFVIEQAPLLLKEFYAWHIFQNIFGIVMGIIIILISYHLRKLWGKKVDSDHNVSWDEVLLGGYASDKFGTIMTILLGVIIGTTLILTSVYDLIYIITAPKLYLIHYFINKN